MNNWMTTAEAVTIISKHSHHPVSPQHVQALVNRGKTRDFVHLLYAALLRNLITQTSSDPWLISLLTYLLDFSGPSYLTQQDQEFLTHLIQKWRQKPAESGTPQVLNIDNVSASSPLLQTKMAEGGERGSIEAKQSYLRYVVKSLEWLEITGLPIGAVAQSALLDEVFIPLQLQPYRPLTEYPLTEREFAEYYRRLRQNPPLRDLERLVFEAEKIGQRENVGRSAWMISGRA